MEIERKWLGRKLVAAIKKQVIGDMTASGAMSENERKMLDTILSEMPMRNLAVMSDGKMSLRMLFRLIHILNGDYLKALTAEPIEAR